MNPRHIVIFGATSRIAEGAARGLAERGFRLTLCARDRERLSDIRADLHTRGSSECEVLPFDALRDDPGDILETAARWAPITDCLIAHAQPPPSEPLGREGLEAYFRINAVSAIAAMRAAAEWIAASGSSGTLAWISSPAALRGRARVGLYGATKASGDVALESLDGAFRGTGLRTLCLRPGPTRTRFNGSRQPSVLWADPERVGRRIAWLMEAGARGERFLPRFWAVPAMALRFMPRRLMARLDR